MVSSGDRSAKIRTYNYPQGRVTDHRINKSLYNLDAFMNGDINEEQRQLFPEGLVPEGQLVPKTVGCKKCYNTGFTGRQAIFELMSPNDAVKRAGF